MAKFGTIQCPYLTGIILTKSMVADNRKPCTHPESRWDCTNCSHYLEPHEILHALIKEAQVWRNEHLQGRKEWVRIDVDIHRNSIHWLCGHFLQPLFDTGYTWTRQHKRVEFDRRVEQLPDPQHLIIIGRKLT